MTDPTVAYVSRLPEPAQYHALFDTTGWNDMYRRTPTELAASLQASWCVVSAFADDRLVGTGRLVSDGILYAVVFDMIVAPPWQRRGIGSEIVRRLLARCDEANIRDVLLFAARGSSAFYQRHGFTPRPSDAPGMLKRTVSA